MDTREAPVPEALLLDCLGTLVWLEDPGPRLRSQLRERLGVDVGAAAAAAAMRAEIAFYRPRMHTAGDAAALARLRRACAETVRAVLLGPPTDDAASAAVATAPVALVEEALLAALVFRPFPDALAALRRWRGAGRRLVVVSNWDASLPEVLERTGVLPLLDGWVASAALGAAKPDPAPVRRGLELAGVEPAAAWLVGDTPGDDVVAAHAAGVAAVLVHRGEAPPPPVAPGVRVVSSLDELP